MAELRHGFKAEAERLAAEEREELQIGPLDPLDPWVLAQNHGVQVVRLSDLPGTESDVSDAVRHFSGPARASFSALLLPIGLGVAIVENETHALTRRISNLAHEMSHLLLEHDFGYVLFDDGCREMDPVVEEEALWLSGELLVPRAGALDCAKNSWTDEQVAELYEVSVAFARMRMNWSGVRRQADRQRRARR